MASLPCLDIDALVAPLPGDDPAGPSVPFATRQALEEARKEVRLEDFDANDPLRPTQAKAADWPGIVRLASETLATKSKDLLTAARLTEALVRYHGYAGLRDGLTLLRRLIEEGWDRLNPTIEDGDLEVRAAPINWLDDADRGARFPSTIGAVPIVEGEDVAFTWLDWRKGQEANDEEKRQAFDRLVFATPRERCQDNVDDLAQAIEEIGGLQRALDARLGELAPGLVAIRKAASDCQTLAQMILGRKGAGPAPAAPVVADHEGGAPAESGNGRPAGRRPTSREEVYEQLAAAAELLQQIEPHSPIPYLIQRAVELGRLPFPQLLKVLIRDANVLTELNRELGIKELQEG